jgi:hypothetical protein
VFTSFPSKTSRHESSTATTRRLGRAPLAFPVRWSFYAAEGAAHYYSRACLETSRPPSPSPPHLPPPPQVVFVPYCDSEAEFEALRERMPWPSVPYTSVRTRLRLKERFAVTELPRVIVLDNGSGFVVNDRGGEYIQRTGRLDGIGGATMYTAAAATVVAPPGPSAAGVPAWAADMSGGGVGSSSSSAGGSLASAWAAGLPPPMAAAAMAAQQQHSQYLHGALGAGGVGGGESGGRPVGGHFGGAADGDGGMADASDAMTPAMTPAATMTMGSAQRSSASTPLSVAGAGGGGGTAAAAAAVLSHHSFACYTPS